MEQAEEAQDGLLSFPGDFTDRVMCRQSNTNGEDTVLLEHTDMVNYAKCDFQSCEQVRTRPLRALTHERLSQ